MPVPTLLRKGYVIIPNGTDETEKSRIENMTAIDYILDFISGNIPSSRSHSPNNIAKKYGDKIIVLKAETGSGKSTVLPSKLYTSFFKNTQRNILVTQPRILTATDIPTSIVDYIPELELDKNIGYNTGEFKRMPRDRGIIFSTIGVLTQQLILDTDEKFIKRYQFVIIDEVHERSIETDLCLFLIKKFLQNNWENPLCPLFILTSATFNEELFINYYDIPRKNYIQVVGSTYKIHANFPKYSIANYIQYATLKAQQLHLQNIDDIKSNSDIRDIIIFVRDSGIGKVIYDELSKFNLILDDLDNIETQLSALNIKLNSHLKSGGGRRYHILPIILDKRNFEKGSIEYKNLFTDLELTTVSFTKGEKIINVRPSRRIIIATNIAETGVTIPTLKYCIDTGYHLSSDFFPEYGCGSLISKNITHGMAMQRRGRVGRKAEGYWYPCYTESTFESLPVDQFSKFITTDITENLLTILIKEKQVNLTLVKDINIIKNYIGEDLFQVNPLLQNDWYKLHNTKETDITGLDFIEPPSIQSIIYSLQKLHILGCIDDEYNITNIGYYINQIRFIPLECKKLIFSGYYYGANILDLITISSFIYTQKHIVFENGFKVKNFLNISEDKFTHIIDNIISDDFINTIFLWNQYVEFVSKKTNFGISKLINWCKDHFIKYEGLMKVLSTRDIIIKNLVELGLDPYKNGLKLDKLEYNLNSIIKNSMDDGLDEIKKIKYCLYEGYKCNMLSYKNGKYVSNTYNLPIKVKSNYTKQKPDVLPARNIIVENFSMSKKFDSEQFEFISNSYCCIMDMIF